ncbi:MAG: hypothetical protein Q6J74_07780 [Gloeomargarita sp. DG02_1_bins_92]
MAAPQWQAELQTQLAQRGIETHCQVKNGVIYLVLKAVKLPSPNEIIPPIISHCNQYQPVAIQAVKIYGQRVGDPFPAWEYEGELGAGFQPELIASTPGKIPLWQRVKQGDCDAISTVLTRALAHKKMQAQVTQTQGILHIQLSAPALPERAIVVKLVEQELRRYPMPHSTGIRLTATAGETVWEEEFELGQSATGKRAIPPVSPPPPATLPLQAIFTADPRVSKTLWIGLISGLILCWIPWLRFLLGYLVIIIHELGHTVAAWGMGYPAIPALDFIHGGGITLQLAERWAIIPVIVYGFMGFLIYSLRRHSLMVMILSGLGLMYTVIYFSRLSELLIIAMGHGCELIFIGLFLCRAMTGWGCQQPGEQTLYGVLGFFMLFYDLNFARQLLFDPVLRELYLMGKGEVLDHDLVRIAREFFRVNLSVVVLLFALGCLLTPLLSWTLVRYQKHWRSGRLQWLGR